MTMNPWRCALVDATLRHLLTWAGNWPVRWADLWRRPTEALAQRGPIAAHLEPEWPISALAMRSRTGDATKSAAVGHRQALGLVHLVRGETKLYGDVPLASDGLPENDEDVHVIV